MSKLSLLVMLVLAVSTEASEFLEFDRLHQSLDEMKTESVKAIQKFYKKQKLEVVPENVFDVSLYGVTLNADKTQITEIVLQSGCDINAEAQGGVPDWCSVHLKQRPYTNASGQKSKKFVITKVECSQHD